MNADSAAALEAALTTEQLGRPVRHFPIAVTTESLALAWARQEGAPEGATVVADQELAPRQRKGATWTGLSTLGLYASVVLRPGLPPEGEELLWLLGSLGAAEGLGAAFGFETAVKWPDDILVSGRKIAGLKVDAQLGPGEIVSAVLTYRVNVNAADDDFPGELRGSATSVRIETGAEADRAGVLDAVLKGVESRYDDDVPALLDAYRARCETIGRSVKALLLPRGEVVGEVAGIDDFGSLLVSAGSTPTRIRVDTLKKLEPAG